VPDATATLTLPRMYPCPFCGVRPVGVVRAPALPDATYAVACFCGSSGPSMETAADAVDAWNRRFVAAPEVTPP